MKMKYKHVFCSLIILFSFVSCKQNDRYGIKSAKKIEVKIHRFDKDLVGLDTTKIDIEVRKLYKTYPGFMRDYVSEIIDEDPSDTLKVRNLMLEFLKDTAFKVVNNNVLRIYDDVSTIKKDVSFAFSGLKHLLPAFKLPEVYFFVSGFNKAFLFNDNYIAIGTDLYLGSDFPKYSEITYNYLTINMRPESVPVDIISALLYKNIQMKIEDERLLDYVIYHGKILFLLAELLPNKNPEYIIGYSKEDIQWCMNFEKEIWSAMVEQKHLFSTDVQLINKYINDAPFTATVSQESPGRLATWIGWQIVESYMDKNRNVTMPELMKEPNAQKILEKSGYKP